MRWQHTVEISAPAERVWALTLAVEDWPTFLPTMSSLRRLEEAPLAVGSQVRIKQPVQKALVWTVTRLDSGIFAWSTTVLWMTFLATHRVESTPRGCNNILVLDLEGWGSSLLGWLLTPLLRYALYLENRGFKRRAEAP